MKLTQTFTFECWSCSRPYRVPVDSVGKRGTCPHCGVKFIVPNPPSATTPPPLPVVERQPQHMQINVSAGKRQRPLRSDSSSMVLWMMGILVFAFLAGAACWVIGWEGEQPAVARFGFWLMLFSPPAFVMVYFIGRAISHWHHGE